MKLNTPTIKIATITITNHIGSSTSSSPPVPLEADPPPATEPLAALPRFAAAMPPSLSPEPHWALLSGGGPLEEVPPVVEPSADVA